MTGIDPFATITRRSLLLAGAGAAATAAIPEVAMGASKAWAGRFAPYKLRSRWEPLVGSTLKVGTGWGTTTVRLIAVSDIPNLSGQTADFRERSFVLTFEGGPFGSEPYSFSHKRLGKCSLSITSAAEGGTFSVVMSNAKLRRKPKRLKKRKQKDRAHRVTPEDRRKARKQRRQAPKAPEQKPAPAPEAAPAPEPPQAVPDAPAPAS